MRLAYLTTCFGTPSHTFIRREIREFRRQGHTLCLYGIHKDTVVAADAQDLVSETHYLYPLSVFAAFGANLHYLFRHPKRYFKAMAMALSGIKSGLKRRLIFFFHFLASAPLARAMQRDGIQHIHAHFLHVPSSLAMFSSRLSGIPFSITIHSAGEQRLTHVDAIPMKLREADLLLMISRFNIEDYSKLEPLAASKAHVVRCGMALEDFPIRTPPESYREPLRILAVGRFVEKKGFAVLLKAIHLLTQNPALNRALELEILGAGPLYDELRAAVTEWDLDAVVKLPGQASTDEVRSKMRAADVVVVPSTTTAKGEMEGIPVVLMEAMATGTPVIASAHSGIPELVNASTGTLVPENDPEALARAIHAFAVNAEQIHNARALIENEFNIHRVVSTRATLFKEALAP